MQVTVKKMVETLDQYRPIRKIIVLAGYLPVSETCKTKELFYWVLDE